MENTAYIAEQQGWKQIDTGELLRREVQKKSEVGKKIVKAFDANRYGKYNFLKK
jgi:adenylate kinase family enzyme